MIIAVEPQQIGTAGRWGKPLAHIAQTFCKLRFNKHMNIFSCHVHFKLS